MTTYFENKGVENTERTLDLAFERARELGIREVVLSSTTGDTTRTLLARLPADMDISVVSVSYHAGLKGPSSFSITDAAREELVSKGVRIITSTHVLSGIERAVNARYKGIYPQLLMADTLRLFGQGTKVAVECAVIAADTGAISGERLISMGGTSRGVDTALVLTPSTSDVFFDLKIHEIICKPAEF